MKLKKVLLVVILISIFLFSAYGFRIKARIKGNTLPDETIEYTYVAPTSPSSHALIDSTSGNTLEIDLTKELLNNGTLNKDVYYTIFDDFHLFSYKFTLKAVEPLSFEDGKCLERCHTGPKAQLVVEDTGGYKAGSGYFKAAIKNRSDWVEFRGRIKYAITDIKVADFRKSSRGEYITTDPNVVVDFCIVFKFKDPMGKEKLPDPYDPSEPNNKSPYCVASIEELLAALASHYREDITESTGKVFVSEGPSPAQCDIDFEKPSEYLELKARPKEKKWREAAEGKKFNMFARDEIEKTKPLELDLSGIIALDTLNTEKPESIYTGKYRFELISFSPKILAKDGRAVRREGVPDAKIRVIELNTGAKKEHIFDYHLGGKTLPADYTYGFGNGKEIIVRLYQKPEELEMPYFLSPLEKVPEEGSYPISKRNAECYNPVCTLHEGKHCRDAYVRFAMKLRVSKKEKLYTWWLTKVKEVEVLSRGPNLTLNVVDSKTGQVLGMAQDTKATISFIDPLTSKPYEITQPVYGGVAKFYIPINTDVTVKIEAFGYESASRVITLNQEPYETSLTIPMNKITEEAEEVEERLVAIKYVVFSYKGFKTLLENYIPHFIEEKELEEKLPPLDGPLTSYPPESYKKAYQLLLGKNIFKLIDRTTNEEVEVTLAIDRFTGTVKDKENNDIPINVVLELKNIYIGRKYKALFFLPTIEGKVSSWKDLKVVTVQWLFTKEGLIESNWQIRDAEEGEWQP